MKKSALTQRAKKRKKPCPDKDGEKYSLQPTGKKDPRTGKDIMECQLDIRGKEGPNKDTEDPGPKM